jgi:hypothetical protein
MQRRRITLKDGRYLIFFTFEDEPQENGDSADKASETENVNVKPQAEADPNV